MMQEEEGEMMRAAELFDKAVAALPPPYKALLAGAAFSALNDLQTVKMVADEISFTSPDEELMNAAGIFLDLRALFDPVDWQNQLAQHVDTERALDFVTGEWKTPFRKRP